MNLDQAIAENAAALDEVTAPALPMLDAALATAAREVAAILRRAPASDDDRWTAHQQAATLAQLRALGNRLQVAGHDAIDGALGDGTAHVGEVALERLDRILTAGAERFGGGAGGLRIDVAAVLGDAERTLMHRHASSAARYAGEVGKEIRSRLMVGILQGENVDQLCRRLLVGSGQIRALAARGPDALIRGASQAAVMPSRRRAEVLVRTELINAYNEVALDGIHAADERDPGYLKKWDAALDRRVCPWCAGLDMQLVGLDQLFVAPGYGSVDHPPLHSCCRCAVVPWRRSWN